MPSGSGEVPSWRCFGGLGAFLRAPDDDDDVAIAAARRRPRGTAVVVGSGRRTNLPRRRADDSSLPLLGSRLEGAAWGWGAEADAVAVGVGRTLPRSHLTVNASQGSVRPWPSFPRFGSTARRGASWAGRLDGSSAVRLDLDLSAHELPAWI